MGIGEGGTGSGKGEGAGECRVFEETKEGDGSKESEELDEDVGAGFLGEVDGELGDGEKKGGAEARCGGGEAAGQEV